jgi:hypothetical protein
LQVRPRLGGREAEQHRRRLIEDADFLHGFGDGALEVWEEVRREL